MKSDNIKGSEGNYSGDHISSVNPETRETQHGIRHGQGDCNWPDGSKYQGAWFMNRREGFGKMAFTDGSRYEGEWKNGKQHGEGTLTTPEGEVMQAKWINGQIQGNAQIKNAKGEKVDAQFNDGVKMISMDTLKPSKFDSDWSWLNGLLVAATVSCGYKGLTSRTKDGRDGWYTCGGLLYTA